MSVKRFNTILWFVSPILLFLSVVSTGLLLDAVCSQTVKVPVSLRFEADVYDKIKPSSYFPDSFAVMNDSSRVFLVAADYLDTLALEDGQTLHIEKCMDRVASYGCPTVFYYSWWIGESRNLIVNKNPGATVMGDTVSVIGYRWELNRSGGFGLVRIQSD